MLVFVQGEVKVRNGQHTCICSCLYVPANLTCPFRMWHNQWLAKMAVAAAQLTEWEDDRTSCKFHVATTGPLKSPYWRCHSTCLTASHHKGTFIRAA